MTKARDRFNFRLKRKTCSSIYIYAISSMSRNFVIAALNGLEIFTHYYQN